MVNLISIPDTSKQVPVGTSYWIKYMKQRIKLNRNYLGGVVGTTGSGKSYSVLSFMELLTDGKVNPDNLCFTAKDFIKRINSGELKPGDVLLWDESGVDMNSKSWQSVSNRVINLVLQVFRHKNLIVFFTMPYLAFLDSDTRKLLHGFMTTEGIDYENKMTILKPLLIQVSQDTGKMYKKYLRVRSPSGITPIRKIKLPKPSQELIQIYEEKKSKFAQDLYLSAMEMIEEMEKKAQKKNKERQQMILIINNLQKEGKSPEDIQRIMGIPAQLYNQILKTVKKEDTNVHFSP